MCGIFGFVSKDKIGEESLKKVIQLSKERGRLFNGAAIYEGSGYKVFRTKNSVDSLDDFKKGKDKVIIGSCGLITDRYYGKKPFLVKGRIVFFEGLVVNETELEKDLSLTWNSKDPIIVSVLEHFYETGRFSDEAIEYLLSSCKGILNIVVLDPIDGKLWMASNNKGLFFSLDEKGLCFATEKYPLEQIGRQQVESVEMVRSFEIPKGDPNVKMTDEGVKEVYFAPDLKNAQTERALLEYPKPNIKRCIKCILPETMPFIEFDEEGVCNYCNHYKLRNVPKPKQQLFDLVEPYRRSSGCDCIVPFSGGRDSCYGLHLIVKELGMKPIAYTYDWGMVSNVGHRNASRVCSELGVRNIVVSDDIAMKRKNIERNLRVWLKKPHLGMISILTAGDKHFFRHLETVKKQTGISLNLWGVNPLEVTHFKAGFLGVAPDFYMDKVYINGLGKQLQYHSHRFAQMLKNPGYFNSSLWDTLSGEYYRSIMKKTDYYHIFDYWQWDEELINKTLLGDYGWEKAEDTNTTWRIGDGTAAFYNYIYYTIAGFTEHDTFRSNQIREGQISREEALMLVEDENRPRYENIKWYLDMLHIDYVAAIKIINSVDRLY